MPANSAEKKIKKQPKEAELGLKMHFEGTAKGRKNEEQKVKSVKSQKGNLKKERQMHTAECVFWEIH